MIIKGSSHSGKGLGDYLLKDKNDRAEVLGIRGDIPRDLSETLDDWRSVTLGTNCTKPLYHAQINPDRALSREEWETAVAVFEKEMGFENQPRAMVLHEFKGREHMHLVYSRIDEDGKAITDSWNYLHHEKAAREIERELGLEHTQGVFIGREGPRPERTPSHDSMQQGERTKIDPRTVKAEVLEIHQSADSPRAFVAGLEDAGYTLAQGDKRGYVILDQAGGVHSLSRALAGEMKAGELREFLRDYPPQELPTVDEARELAQARAQRPEHDAELTAPDSARAFALGDSAHVTRLNSDSPAPEIEQAAPVAVAVLELASMERATGAEIDAAPSVAAAQIDRAAPAEREGFAVEIDHGADLGGSIEGGVGNVASVLADAAERVLDGVANLFEGFMGATSPPTLQQRLERAQQREEAQEARFLTAEERIRQAQESHTQQQERDKAQERERDEGRTRDDWGR